MTMAIADDNMEDYNETYMSEDDILEFYKMNEDIESGALDLLDMDIIGSLGYSEVASGRRGTNVTEDSKLYIKNDDGKKIKRIEVTGKNNEGHLIRLKKGEYLSKIIDVLPYGLIDKQATGIGATTLELECERNSIIVTPTRALALNKSKSTGHEKCPYESLYVGGDKITGKRIHKSEILDYIDDTSIKEKPKKFIVVADSLPFLIDILDKKCGESKYGKEVYRDYFLLVDEIDSLQQDSSFRPRLSRVIDYYFRFKKSRRALMSATVQEFSHPKLKEELVTVFKTIDPEKRDIILFYTQNINLTLAKLIERLHSKKPEDKILIAFNSIRNILKVIKLLPEDVKKECSILCGDKSKTEVDHYYGELNEEDKTLPSAINFMTCVYFAGVDIKGKCHLITVSDTKSTHTTLSLNRIIQVYGRCRDGVLSDNIVYNTTTKTPCTKKNNYREELEGKADKVLKLLDAADKLNDDSVKGVFDRIKHLIIENSYERFNNDTSCTLVRATVDKKREPAYFNIDSLCENAETFNRLYRHRDDLYKQLEDKHNVSYDNSLTIEELPNQKEIEKETDEERKNRILEKLKDVKLELIELSKRHELNDNELKKKIRNSNRIRIEEEFYQRVKLHYQYIDVEFLVDRLEEIALINRKAYRGIKNSLSFFILEDKHPFKLEVMNKFIIGKSYSSDEIKTSLSPIVEYHFFYKNLPRPRLVALFKVIFTWTYSRGKYRIKGYNPLNVPTPKMRISSEEKALNEYFEV